MGAVSHLSYANVTATLALFVALGGGAYAAATLPRDSVGTAQLRTAAVTLPKLGVSLGSAGSSANAVNLPTAYCPPGAPCAVLSPTPVLSVTLRLGRRANVLLVGLVQAYAGTSPGTLTVGLTAQAGTPAAAGPSSTIPAGGSVTVPYTALLPNVSAGTHVYRLSALGYGQGLSGGQASIDAVALPAQ